MTTTIDSATRHDAGAINEVLYQTWRATYPNDAYGVTMADIERTFKDRASPARIARREQQIAERPETVAMFVARDDGTMVGLCFGVREQGANRITALYVLPTHQGQGIGTRLVEAVQPVFDPATPTRVRVAVYNEHAQRFYAGLGFVDTGVRFADERYRMPESTVIIPEIEMERRAGHASGA